MKVVDKKVGNTTYYKYRINLPIKIIEDSNLLEEKLKVRYEKEKIIIERE